MQRATSQVMPTTICTFQGRLQIPEGFILAWKSLGTSQAACHLEHAKDVGKLLTGHWITVGDERNWVKHRLVFRGFIALEPLKMKFTLLDKAWTTGNAWL